MTTYTFLGDPDFGRVVEENKTAHVIWVRFDGCDQGVLFWPADSILCGLSDGLQRPDKKIWDPNSGHPGLWPPVVARDKASTRLVEMGAKYASPHHTWRYVIVPSDDGETWIASLRRAQTFRRRVVTTVTVVGP